MAMIAGLDILPSHWTMDWSLPTQKVLEWVHQSSRTLQTLPVERHTRQIKQEQAREGELEVKVMPVIKMFMMMMMMMTMTTTTMMMMMMMMMMMIIIMISTTAAASYFKM